jgi:hypothetical protein
LLLNNIIANNQGRYGPGIVLNYSGAVIKNNLICYNSGGQSYNGGGSVWANSDPVIPAPKIIENNTIYSNHAAVGTGGILCLSTSVTVRNNILWNNTSPNNSQVYLVGGTATVTYSDIQGGYAGSGNINVNPLFSDTASFYLMPLSPCIDAGDSSAIYNDIENSGLPGFALLPSLGTIRNDMGAYGGQGAFDLGQGQVTGIGTLVAPGLMDDVTVFPNPAFNKFTVRSRQFAVRRIQVMNVIGEMVMEENNFKNENSIFVNTEQLKRGIYFVKVISSESTIIKKIVLK